MSPRSLLRKAQPLPQASAPRGADENPTVWKGPAQTKCTPPIPPQTGRPQSPRNCAGESLARSRGFQNRGGRIRTGETSRPQTERSTRLSYAPGTSQSNDQPSRTRATHPCSLARRNVSAAGPSQAPGRPDHAIHPNRGRPAPSSRLGRRGRDRTAAGAPLRPREDRGAAAGRGAAVRRDRRRAARRAGGSLPLQRRPHRPARRQRALRRGRPPAWRSGASRA